MPEFINPNTHTVFLVGADGQTVKIGAGQKKLLPDFFERYCSKGYIRKATSEESTVAQQQRRVGATGTPNKSVKPTGNAPRPVPPPGPSPAPRTLDSQLTARQPRRTLGVQRDNKSGAGKKAPRIQKKIVNQPPAPPPPQRIVGRRINEDATALLRNNLQVNTYPISNNIGVGILSYNRADSLKRLIESIRKHTDLRRTTIFISDDGSTDSDTKAYLSTLALSSDFVVLANQYRLGVAGNSNRLLRCLSRFRHCLMLNDDVEILRTGWDSFYNRGLSIGAVKHFCMRQPGVYGARDGERITINGVDMTKVYEKPHGAVLSFSSDVIKKIGYFDEQFGLYGMEHVDWSGRVSSSGLQPAGFYDVVGSHDYFKIHNERSAVESREKHLADAKKLMGEIEPGRSYVAPTGRSAVPVVSVVIPCRNTARHGGIQTVIAGIRAQRFPAIEMIVVEHDVNRQIDDGNMPLRHVLVQSDGRPFNKSRAFNAGVAIASSPYLLLHDADIVLPAWYTQRVYDTLQSHDAGHFGKTVIYLTHESSNTVNQTGVITLDAECERVVGYYEGGSLFCRRGTYWKVGAFNEDFWGYGVEDCEFYERLAKNSNWKEDRALDFVHVWHGRGDGWMQEHTHNKELGKTISSAPMAQRIQNRYSALKQSNYGDQLDAALKGVI